MPSQIASDAVVHQQVGRVAGVMGDRLDHISVPGSTSSTAGCAASRYPQKHVSGVAGKRMV